METKKLGRQTVRFSDPPAIVGCGSVAGSKEGRGPLGHCFDLTSRDDRFHQESWEKAETTMQKKALSFALNKAGLTTEQLDYVLAGDLLNQCIATSYSMRTQEIPFFGLYGACSTMAEGLSLGAMLIDGGFASYTAALTSSHFCSAERQYRNPLEYGGQKPPTAQWTTTGAGAVILSRKGDGPFVTHVTTGKIVDKGITDANNMGAAMLQLRMIPSKSTCRKRVVLLTFMTASSPEIWASWVRKSSESFSGRMESNWDSAMQTAGYFSLILTHRTFTQVLLGVGAALSFSLGICCSKWQRKSIVIFYFAVQGPYILLFP